MMAGQLIEAGQNRLQRDIDRWTGAANTLKNYETYIKTRGVNIFDIGYIDLLFVSNYKGGNSTIGGSSEDVYKRLHPHRERLALIKREFANNSNNYSLASLSADKKGNLKNLSNLMADAFNDCKAENSCIKGFGTAYCSALYHLHFPDLIPVIDRRVLINGGFERLTFIGTQVKDLHIHYDGLLERIHADLDIQGLYKSMRDWDKDFFTRRIPKDHKTHQTHEHH